MLALRSRIELYGDDTLTKAMPSQAIVEIKLRDGRELRRHVKAVRGTSENPMKREEVDFKSLEEIRKLALAEFADQGITQPAKNYTTAFRRRYSKRRRARRPLLTRFARHHASS